MAPNFVNLRHSSANVSNLYESINFLENSWQYIVTRMWNVEWFSSVTDLFFIAKGLIIGQVWPDYWLNRCCDMLYSTTVRVDEYLVDYLATCILISWSNQSSDQTAWPKTFLQCLPPCLYPFVLLLISHHTKLVFIRALQHLGLGF